MPTNIKHPSLLAGILWDSDGRRMTPSHANKNGARYRYYISRQDKERLSLPLRRVPAGEFEKLVAHQLRKHTDASWNKLLPAREMILQHIGKITVHPDCIVVRFVGVEEPVTVTASLIRNSGETRIAAALDNWPDARLDAPLIKLIVRAHQVRKALADPDNGSIEAAASSMELSTQYFCRLLRLSYLAPDITTAILDGRQPAHLNRQFLARVNSLPIDWAGQREMLGFA